MIELDKTRLTEVRVRAVRAELNDLLDSAAFRTSKRCRDFLEYVVERTLRGESDSLKERSIGVELFQLPPDFDAGQHTIVRVTANEVRKKLAQHYLTGNGESHAVRIELPPGSYRAEFRWATPAAEAQDQQRPDARDASVDESGPPTQETPKGLLNPSRTPRLWVALAGAAALLVAASALAFWRFQGEPAAPPAAPSEARSTPTPAAATGFQPSDGLRMIMGATNPYIDRNGWTWSPDRYFSGGTVVFRPSEKILRTLDPDIYRHLRSGDFQYDIPLPKGLYELRLHFAETGLDYLLSAESSGEGQRLFRIVVNGRTVLTSVDVVANAAGANTADVQVLRDITPAEDGFLHLSFAGVKGAPMLSAIEILPMVNGKVRPTRIRAGFPSSWCDSAGRQWQADSYFLGGNALVRTTNPAREDGSMVHDRALYASERWGHFSYAVPVANGRYRVTLKFCEGHYGRRNSGSGGVGSRLFDVYCNGVALLRNFDIIKEAGGEGRPIDRVFTGIRPTAQGKIVLTFVPVVGMACVNGIEVVEE